MASTSPPPCIRVVVLLNPTKTSRFASRGLFEPIAIPATATPAVTQAHLSVVQLDSARVLESSSSLLSALEKQGEFHLLLVKLTDLMVKALYEKDTHSQNLLDAIQSYVSSHSNVKLVEPFSAVERTLNRWNIQQQIVNGNMRTPEGHQVTAPFSFRLTYPLLEALPSSLPFPLLLKRLPASGSALNHTMYIIQSEEQISMLPPGEWMAQRLIQNLMGNCIYKIYVLGEKSYAAAKPSIPSLDSSAPPLFFNSQDMILYTLDGQPFPIANNSTLPPTDSSSRSHYSSPSSPFPLDVNSIDFINQISSISCQLQSLIHLGLFGYDLLISSTDSLSDTSSSFIYYIVDINYFPSYNQVENFADKLKYWLLQQAEK